MGTPLHVAAKRGNVDVIRLLVEAGVDPNLPDAGIGPPLHLALQYRRTEAVNLLRELGAEPQVADPVDHLIAKADIDLGRDISVACEACHTLEADPSDGPTTGPSLWGIIGRPMGSETGFGYSDVLINAEGIWTYASLNNFLANPRAFMPGTKMNAFVGIEDPERRAALLLYLRSLADVAVRLP